MNIEIYTKANCFNCVSAKKLLDGRNLKYVEYDTDDPHVMLALVMRYPEVRQMPQIFINDQRVGGLAGLQAALKKASPWPFPDAPLEHAPLDKLPFNPENEEDAPL